MDKDNNNEKWAYCSNCGHKLGLIDIADLVCTECGFELD